MKIYYTQLNYENIQEEESYGVSVQRLTIINFNCSVTTQKVEQDNVYARFFSIINCNVCVHAHA